MAFFRAKAGQKARFYVMLKYFEIKNAFRYYIKQIDSMLPCVWFSNRSQKTSKCGKNSYASCATFSFLPHYDVICDLLLNRRTATWNLFVKPNQCKRRSSAALDLSVHRFGAVCHLERVLLVPVITTTCNLRISMCQEKDTSFEQYTHQLGTNT